MKELQVITPQVSVIMPVYNAKATVAASISSVLRQSFEYWELIIIDDCSQDGSRKIVKSIARGQPRIRLFSNKSNKGTAYSRNVGIAKSRGKWIAFLDSDDLWRVDKLEKQVRLMQESGALISYTGTTYMDSEGDILKYYLKANQKLTYRELLKRNIMSCSSVMVRRDVMKREMFSNGHLHEDYAAWMSIVKKVGYAHGLNEPLLTYRLSKGSKSSGRINSALMTYRAYRYVRFSSLASFVLMLRYAMHSITKRLSIRLGGFTSRR